MAHNPSDSVLEDGQKADARDAAARMRSPLIGITTRRVSGSGLGGRTPQGLLDAPLDAVFADYAESLSMAGATPVLIPRVAVPADLVARLDGLVLSGGEDVLPALYGREPGRHATAHDPDRDAFEVALIDAALAAGLPVLAVCRGVQILNVALGGTLVDHLAPSGGFDHAASDAHRSVRRHEVAVADGCTLATVFAAELADGRMHVNSYHHQAVETPGRDLVVVAHAFDGTVEAVEHASRPVVGVQWHPEMHEGVDPLFHWLVEQASEGRR